MGYYSSATGYSSTALGYFSSATNSYATAVGDATASGMYSSAVGYQARASHTSSTAIGYYAKTTTSNQIVLGSSSTTVYIPGNLVVGRNTYLGADYAPSIPTRSPLYIRFNVGSYSEMSQICEHSGSSDDIFRWGNHTVNYSDRRLKNVGEVFSDGLDKIKQLKVYNYTFKDDKSKTPRVGVIAQDLQKVFPDAVTKGDDGFLRIRWEDMFYALINAIKELDTKFTALNNRIKQLETQNKQLEKQNKELEERLNKLEKRFYN